MIRSLQKFVYTVIACMTLSAVSAEVVKPPDAEMPDSPAVGYVPPTQEEPYGYELPWFPLQIGAVGRYQLFTPSTNIHGFRFGLLSVDNDFVDGISLSTVYNKSFRQRGIEVAGVVNYNEFKRSKATSGGIRLAGIANAVNNKNEKWQRYRGFTIAGIWNGVSDQHGISFAGLANTSHVTSGFQASFLLNQAETIKGIQLAGFFNNNTESAKIEGKPASSAGIHIAGLVNHYQHDNLGVSIALAYNENEQTSKGVQVAAVNYANKVNGIQIGLVNDTDELSGIQIGLFNFKDKKIRFPIINVGFGKKKE